MGFGLRSSSGVYAALRLLVAVTAIAAIGVAARSIAGLHAPEDLLQEPPAPAIELLYVRPLIPVESGRNDSNPVWSPSGALIALERSRGDKKEIVIARPDGTVVHTIYYQLSESSTKPKFFFPGVVEDISYNAGITWSRTGDRLVFMSNGGTGNYDLYLRALDGKTTRLTDHKEKDGHAHWSPVADQLVFVSGRSGEGDIYLLDVTTRAVTGLTWGAKPHLYPAWMPDSNRIVYVRNDLQEYNPIYVADLARKINLALKTDTKMNHDIASSADGVIAFRAQVDQWDQIFLTKMRD